MGVLDVDVNVDVDVDVDVDWLRSMRLMSARSAGCSTTADAR
jgi:hypothetical protein